MKLTAAFFLSFVLTSPAQSAVRCPSELQRHLKQELVQAEKRLEEIREMIQAGQAALSTHPNAPFRLDRALEAVDAKALPLLVFCGPPSALAVFFVSLLSAAECSDPASWVCMGSGTLLLGGIWVALARSLAPAFPELWLDVRLLRALRDGTLRLVRGPSVTVLKRDLALERSIEESALSLANDIRQALGKSPTPRDFEKALRLVRFWEQRVQKQYFESFNDRIAPLYLKNPRKNLTDEDLPAGEIHQLDEVRLDGLRVQSAIVYLKQMTLKALERSCEEMLAPRPQSSS